MHGFYSQKGIDTDVAGGVDLVVPNWEDSCDATAKNFALPAGRRLQIRVDAFGVLNKKNWSDPSSAVNASDFGRITMAGGSRIIQIGARVTF